MMEALSRLFSILHLSLNRFVAHARTSVFKTSWTDQLLYVGYRNRYVLLYSLVTLFLLLLKIRLASELLPLDSAIVFFVAMKVSWGFRRLSRTILQYARMKMASASLRSTDESKKMDAIFLYLFLGVSQLVIFACVLGATFFLSRGANESHFYMSLILAHLLAGVFSSTGSLRQAMAIGERRVRQNFWTIYSPILLELVCLVAFYVFFAEWTFVVSPLVGGVAQYFVSVYVTRGLFRSENHPRLKEVFSVFWQNKSLRLGLPYLEAKTYCFPRILMTFAQLAGMLLAVRALYQTDPFWAYVFGIMILTAQALGKIGTRFGKSIHFDIQRAIHKLDLPAAWRLSRLAMLTAPLAFVSSFLLASLLKQMGTFDWVFLMPKIHLAESTWSLLIVGASLMVARQSLDMLWAFYPNRYSPAWVSLGVYAIVVATLFSGVENLYAPVVVWGVAELSLGLYTLLSFWSASRWIYESPYLKKNFALSRGMLRRAFGTREGRNLGNDPVSQRVIRDFRVFCDEVEASLAVSRLNPKASQFFVYIGWNKKISDKFVESIEYRSFLKGLRTSDPVFELPNRDLLVVIRAQEHEKMHQFANRLLPPIVPYCEDLAVVPFDGSEANVLSAFDRLFQKVSPMQLFSKNSGKQFQPLRPGEFEEMQSSAEEYEKYISSLEKKFSTKRRTLPNSFEKKFLIGHFGPAYIDLFAWKKLGLLPVFQASGPPLCLELPASHQQSQQSIEYGLMRYLVRHLQQIAFGVCEEKYLRRLDSVSFHSLLTQSYFVSSRTGVALAEFSMPLRSLHSTMERLNDELKGQLGSIHYRRVGSRAEAVMLTRHKWGKRKDLYRSLKNLGLKNIKTVWFQSEEKEQESAPSRRENKSRLLSIAFLMTSLLGPQLEAEEPAHEMLLLNDSRQVEVRDRSLFIKPKKSLQDMVYTIRGVGPILPLQLSEDDIAERASSAAVRVIRKKWLAPKRAEGKCSVLSPCEVQIDPNESNQSDSRDFVEELLKTCWFQVSPSQRYHYKKIDRYDRILNICEYAGLGAYQFINSYEYQKANRSFRDKAKDWVFGFMNRLLKIRDLLVGAKKLSIEDAKVGYRKGGEIRAPFMQTLRSAQRRIRIATFNLSDKESFEVLEQKAQAGLDVEVLFDLDFMFSETRLKNLSRLVAAGARIYPIPGKATLDARASFHPKVYLVDDTVYVGTFNLGYQASNVIEETLVLESGPWAQEFLKIMDFWRARACSDSFRTALMLRQSCPEAGLCEPIASSLESHCAPFEATTYSLKGLQLKSSQMQVIADGRSQLKEIFRLFRKAEKKILVKSVEITYEPLLFYLNSLRREKPWLSIVVQIPEYNRNSIKPESYPYLKFEYGETGVHEKSIVVDDRYALITSANFSHRGFFYNEEIALIYDREILQKN